MKHITKRTLALLMSLMLMVSLFVGVAVPAQAATVNYKYSGNYVYNWGTRGTVATFLSPMAEAFYEDNGVTYDQLASYAGSSSTASVPSSALYKQLQNLMKNAQTYQTSYDATRDLFRYTDCQNNGSPTSISAFYSGTAVGPAWDSGKTWNREHVWPNSKGDDTGNGENDIMMLRPETSSNNSARGNKAYGESSSYYDPNGLGQKVRGDAARILLYTYVRWGGMSMWGSSGVIESKAILLKWMEEDPVDTWELARNDAVESITGTRNVFVDYPELAFEMFEATMPTNWTTPSGEATDGNQGNVDQPDIPTPDVPTTGEGVVTEPQTGVAYKLGLDNGSAVYYATGAMSGFYGATETSVDAAADFYLEATNGGYHLYSTAGGSKQYVNLVLSGTYYNYTYGATASSVFTLDAEKNALCTTVGTEVCYMGTYGTYVTMGVLRTSKLKETDYIARLYGSEDGTTPDTPDTPVDVPTPDTSLTIPAANDLGSAMASGVYTEGKYYVSGTIRNIENSTYGNMTIADAAGNTFYIYGTYNADGTLKYGEMADKPVVGDTVTIYGPIGNYNGAPQSKNAWITSVTPGSGSGSDQPTGGVSISLMDVANRVSGSAAQQVWQQNGITVTNDKGTSTSDINLDYYNPVRFYKNSDVTIAYPGMTRIVINASVTTGQYAKDYAAPWMDSNTDTNATATVDGDVVTIVFANPVDSYKVTLTTGQARAFTITVYGEGGNLPDVPDVPDVPDTPANETLTISEAIALGTSQEHNTYTEELYYVTGKVVEYYNNYATYGNMYIADDAGNRLLVYGLYSEDGTVRYDAMDVKPVIGDTITVYGVIGQYNDNPQMKNGWLTAHVPGGTTPDVPDQPDQPDQPDVPVDPAGSVTIDFCNGAERTDFTNDRQVWEQNGIVVTNNKAGSSQPVGDYGGSGYPVRFYQNSSLNISYPDMVKLVFNCNDYKDTYPSALEASITTGTVSVDGTVVTVVLPEAVDSFDIAAMSAQVRVDSIVIYVATPDVPDEPCAHEYDNACDAECNLCGEIRTVGDHVWVNGACDICGIASPSQVTITSESATASYAKMGAKVSAKVTAEGDGLTYTWYIKNEGSSKYSKSSVTKATYSTTMSDKAKNRRIYCVVEDAYGNQAKSKTFILRESVSITSESATARYAKLGAKVSAKVSASGDGLKYTWYIKNAGKTSYSKSSVTSSTYSVTMSSKVKGRKVYCIVTDKYGKKVQSKTFILRESVSIVTQPKTVTVAKNKTAKVTVKASGDGLKYTWYIKNDGAKKYSKSSITKSSYSVTMTSKVKNRLVYCVVTDKYGKTVKSTTVKLKMK